MSPIPGHEDLGLFDLPVDKPVVSHLLLAVGMELDGPEAAAVVLGATDVLLSLDLAQTLPAEADFADAIRCLHTFREEPVIPAVREGQRRVLSLFADQLADEILGNPQLALRVEQLQSWTIAAVPGSRTRVPE